MLKYKLCSILLIQLLVYVFCFIKAFIKPDLWDLFTFCVEKLPKTAKTDRCAAKMLYI